jgi:hypothetical protein
VTIKTDLPGLRLARNPGKKFGIDFTSIFNNKKVSIYTIYVNNIYTKLNCASNSVKNYVLFLSINRVFFIGESIVSIFRNPIIKSHISNRKNIKKCFKYL